MRLDTSLRSRAPGQTEALARPLMRALRLSNPTDITRLDRLGVPVFVSRRRGAGALSVHAGKGLVAQDARLGAIMEGIEHAVAQRASAGATPRRIPLDALVASWPRRLALADFAPRLGVDTRAPRSIPALRCEDLIGGASALLPAELLLVAPAVEAPQAPEPALFGWSTNGLASGNTLPEATLHGLLEVLERDTIALHAARSEAAAVACNGLPTALAQRAARWAADGVQLQLRWLPNAVGLPCFEATLHEPGHPVTPRARGWGLHLDREVALARAVSEAAQSRLCRLHRASAAGRAFYAELPALNRGAADERVQAAAAAPRREVAFDAVPTLPCASVREALQAVLARLPRAGFRHVFRHRLRLPAGGPDLRGLQVVKVVVPGCETVLGPHPRMGPRLFARVTGGPG